MIRGNQIILRTVRETDLDMLFAFESDLANKGDYYGLHLPSEPEFKKRFRETGFWEEENGLLLICADEKIVGKIRFFKGPPYTDALEIGYILYDENSRGKGYATEAVLLAVKFLFGTKKMNRLQIAVAPENTASKRIAEKCGFKFEGVARGVIFLKGKYHDVEIYSLLRDEVAL